MDLPDKLRAAFLFIFLIIIVLIMPFIASIIEVGPSGASHSNETFATKFPVFLAITLNIQNITDIDKICWINIVFAVIFLLAVILIGKNTSISIIDCILLAILLWMIWSVISFISWPWLYDNIGFELFGRDKSSRYTSGEEFDPGIWDGSKIADEAYNYFYASLAMVVIMAILFIFILFKAKNSTLTPREKQERAMMHEHGEAYPGDYKIERTSSEEVRARRERRERQEAERRKQNAQSRNNS